MVHQTLTTEQALLRWTLISRTNLLAGNIVYRINGLSNFVAEKSTEPGLISHTSLLIERFELASDVVGQINGSSNFAVGTGTFEMDIDITHKFAGQMIGTDQGRCVTNQGYVKLLRRNGTFDMTHKSAGQ